MKRTAIVIGDCFAGYQQGDNVYTVSAFIKAIRTAIATAAKAFSAFSADPGDCFAYGDPLSDLDLFETIGTAGIVPNDPELIAIATERNWRILQ